MEQDMTKDEALDKALYALKASKHGHLDHAWADEAITAIKQARSAPVQEPVAYDKTELNCFAQNLYDQKMCEGKRGHYESMFHVIHQCIKKVAPAAQRQWVGLTEDEVSILAAALGFDAHVKAVILKAEAKLKEKNT
jgi:hypothetical protein